MILYLFTSCEESCDNDVDKIETCYFVITSHNMENDSIHRYESNVENSSNVSNFNFYEKKNLFTVGDTLILKKKE